MSNIMTVSGLTKRFDGAFILDHLNFSVESGRIVGLMGPNGAGKTTLFKTIMQLYHADQGKILICGNPAGYQTRNLVSYMPDTNHLFNWMRIRDAIQYFADMFEDFDLLRAKELCSSMNLNEKQKVKTLSKGMVEQVLIMLTFARKARLYLLDEPISGIDPLGREKILKTILAGVNENSSVMISTHLVKDVETIVDDVLFINKGQLVFFDSAEYIRETRGQSIEECYLEVFNNA